MPGRYPVLTAWMVGARADHPFAGMLSRLDADDRGQWATLDDVEAVLEILHAAAPAGLDGKQRQFGAIGRGAGALRSIQAELVLGAYLARHRVGFGFGVPGGVQPDLVLPEVNLGLDITAQQADAVWALRNHLTFAMRDVQPPVQLGLQVTAHPFAIPLTVRNAIVDRVRAALSSGETEVQCVLRPAGPDHASITLRVTIAQPAGLSWPRVTVQRSGALLPPSIGDVEDGLMAAIEEAREHRQARPMPTVLVVDIGHLSGAWLRSAQPWGDRLIGLLHPEDGFAALAMMVSSGWVTDFPFMLAQSPHAAPSAIDSLRRFEQAFGRGQPKARARP